MDVKPSPCVQTGVNTASVNGPVSESRPRAEGGCEILYFSTPKKKAPSPIIIRERWEPSEGGKAALVGRGTLQRS